MVLKNQFLGRLATRIANRPLVGLGCLLLLVALSLSGVAKLRFSDDIDTIFSSDSSMFEEYRDLRQRIVLGENDIFIVIKTENSVTEQILRAVSEYALEASLLQNVDGVFSVLSLPQFSPVSGEWSRAVTLPLQSGLDQSQLQEAVNHPLNQGVWIAQDLKSLGLQILVSNGQGGPLDQFNLRLLLVELEALRQDVFENQPVQFHWSGTPIVRLSVIDILIREQFTLNSIGIVIGFLVCTVLLGSWRLALLTALPAVFGLLFVLGFLGHLGFPITVITNVLPILTLLLGFADSMHLTFNWRKQMQVGERLVEVALGNTVRRIGPACVLTAVTTAIAFASLTLIEYQLISEFGVAGAISVFITLLAVLTVFPLTFSLASRFGFLKSDDLKRGKGDRFLQQSIRPFVSQARRAPLKITIAGILFTATALVLSYQAESHYAFQENLSQTSDIATSISIIDDHYGGSHAIDLEVPFDFSTDERLQRSLLQLRKVHADLEVLMPTYRIFSPWTLFAGMDADISKRLIEQMDSRLRNRLFSADGSSAVVKMIVPDLGSRQFESLINRINDHFAATGAETRANGIMVISTKMSHEALDQLKTSLLLTGLLAALLLGAVYRRLDYLLIAVVPNLLPIAAATALLFITGTGLQFASTLALIIALGIAVDDTIHMLNYLQHHGQDGPQGLVENVGPVLLATSIVLVFGISATALSVLPTVALFGMLSVLVIVLAFLADVLLLPAAVVLLDGRR